MDLTKYPELKKVRSMKVVPNKFRTPVYAYVWKKILRSRDFYVSKAFKERLNSPTFQQVIENPDIEELSSWSITQIEFQSHHTNYLTNEIPLQGIGELPYEKRVRK
jgi:hypothetical protein